MDLFKASRCGPFTSPGLEFRRLIAKRISTNVLVESTQRLPVWDSIMNYARPRAAKARKSPPRGAGVRGAQRTPRVMKPLIFTISVVAVSFGVAVYKDVSDHNKQLREIEENKGLSPLKKVLVSNPFRAKMNQEAATSEDLDTVELLRELKKVYWDSKSPAYKLCLKIAVLNFGIYCAWKVPVLHRTMARHFLHIPSRNKLHTLVGSVFSHKTILHYAANTYVMMQFGPIFGQILCPTSEIYLFAYFISSGTISSLAQHLFSRISLGAASMHIGSLGASGAVWAILSGLAYLEPHAHISMIFLPGIEFELWQGCLALAALDIIGLFRRYTPFSHSAHLGGAISGVVLSYATLKFPHASKRPPNPKVTIVAYSRSPRNPWI